MADGVEIGKGYVEVTADTVKLDAKVANVPQKFAAIEASAQKMGNQIKQSGTNGAMGLMMLSQMVDDMQYGFRSIVNNIPQVGMALGSALGMSSEAAMKFGGTLGIVAVAVNVLITHWDDLMDGMGLGKVQTEAEAMERLGKATKLTADEQDRLNRYKRDQKVMEELKDKRSSGQEKTEAELKSTYADLGNENATGFDRLVSGLVASRAAQGQGAKEMPSDKEARATPGFAGDVRTGFTGFMNRVSDAIYGAAHKVTGGVIGDHRSKKAKDDEIKERLREEDIARAKATVSGAVNDPVKRKELIAEMRRNPGAFPAGAADKLEAIKPSKNTADQAAEDLAKKQSDQLDAANKADYDRWKQKRDAEDTRLANAMKESVGQKFLNNPGMDDKTLQAEIKESMKKAGMGAQEIADALSGTAKKLRENMNKAIKDRALDRGITEDVARAQLAREAQQRDDAIARKEMGGKTAGEFTSGADAIFQKMQLEATAADIKKAQGGVDKDKILEDQLKAQQEMGVNLEEINKSLKEQKQPELARFGGRGWR